MAKAKITAPPNPFADRAAVLESLEKKPVRTPAENERYIQLLEEEVARLQEPSSM